MHSHPLSTQQKSRGFSVLEILIGVVVIIVVVGYVAAALVKGNKDSGRISAAMDIAHGLQKARADSVHRKAQDIGQMAQVRIFNRRLYSIALDADGDGNLDVPLVKELPEAAGIEFEGPFPKTFIFDSRGQTVDAQNTPVKPPVITITNSAGGNSIRFDQEGKVVVGAATKGSSTR